MCSVGRAKLWRLCPAFLQPQRLESKIEGAAKKEKQIVQACVTTVGVIVDNYSGRQI